MLSELCVRRPVFATMLVMSLVVLGIFSFRDLGVDLFPKADPATVSVALQLPGASPDEMVTSVVLSSDAMSLRTLTEIADKQVKRAIETANGVGEVTLGGGRAREVHVVVDIEKLNAYGLSLADVRDAVTAENVEIPGGTVEQGKSQLLLRTLGRIDATDQFNNIVVSTKNGTPIRVSDIGYAEDSFERPISGVWLNGTPAVVLDIKRAMGENTVEVIEGVKKKLASIRKTLPAAVTPTMTRDDSKFIYSSVAALEEHLIWGSLFAAVVVMFFIRNIR